MSRKVMVKKKNAREYVLIFRSSRPRPEKEEMGTTRSQYLTYL